MLQEKTFQTNMQYNKEKKAYKFAVSFSWADNIGGVYKTSAFGSSGSCKGLLTPFRRMPRLRDPCLI